MNCPLCKKLLIEIDMGNASDFTCSEEVRYGASTSLPHFEWSYNQNYYKIRVPPYLLLVQDDYSDVCSASELGTPGEYAEDVICTLNTINKKNIDEFVNDYENLGQKIKRLILFS